MRKKHWNILKIRGRVHVPFALNLQGDVISSDGNTYEWNGKQLTKVTAADGSYTAYEYDINGLRTLKLRYHADGLLDHKVEYVWSDGKVITQRMTVMLYIIQNGKVLSQTEAVFTSKVLYDESGTAQGYSVAGLGTYMFVRNLQGDVIALIDAKDGRTMIEYAYDAWGNMEYTIIGEACKTTNKL